MPDKYGLSLYALVHGNALAGIFSGANASSVYKVNLFFDTPEQTFMLAVFTGIGKYDWRRLEKQALVKASRVRITVGKASGEAMPGLASSGYCLPSDIGLPNELDGFFFFAQNGGNAVHSAFIPWEIADRVVAAAKEYFDVKPRVYLLRGSEEKFVVVSVDV